MVASSDTHEYNFTNFVENTVYLRVDMKESSIFGVTKFNHTITSKQLHFQLLTMKTPLTFYRIRKDFLASLT
jgi:hypothetical protein